MIVSDSSDYRVGRPFYTLPPMLSLRHPFSIEPGMQLISAVECIESVRPVIFLYNFSIFFPIYPRVQFLCP